MGYQGNGTGMVPVEWVRSGGGLGQCVILRQFATNRAAKEALNK